MAKRIALFNHKGGVSKTTTTFNLGWMLALKGKRVIMVDADPQCNLTGFVLDEEEFEDFYENPKNDNLKSSLAPAFEAQPKLIEPAKCLSIKDKVKGGEVEGLFLLPGHLNLSEYEVTLGIAQKLSDSLHTLRNLPGSFSDLFEKTAKEYEADYILIDMNPSLSSINQNLLMTSDYFLVPTSPDYFSFMALNAFKTILPQWATWAKDAMSSPTLQKATYPFPQITPKFLGIVVQNYREYKKEPTKAFQKWIDKIEQVVSDSLSDSLFFELKNNGMTLRQSKYNAILAKFSDFNTLIALSQIHKTPIFALSDQQTGYSGSVLNTFKKSRAKFKEVFSNLADRVIQLTN